MPATLCENCLTKDAVSVIVFGDELCERCGVKPERGTLIPPEIRKCLKTRAGIGQDWREGRRAKQWLAKSPDGPLSEEDLRRPLRPLRPIVPYATKVTT